MAYVVYLESTRHNCWRVWIKFDQETGQKIKRLFSFTLFPTKRLHSKLPLWQKIKRDIKKFPGTWDWYIFHDLRLHGLSGVIMVITIIDRAHASHIKALGLYT